MIKGFISIRSFCALALLSGLVFAAALAAGPAQAEQLNTGAGPWEWMRPNVQGSTINAMSFVDGNTGWAVGIGGTILKTTDGGATWASQASGTSYNLTGVKFVDANNGWAVGMDTLYNLSGIILHTTDGGYTWKSQSYPASQPAGLSGVSFASASSGAAVGQSSGKYAFYTTNGGGSWAAASGVTSTLNNVQLVDASNGYAVGYGAIYKTSNGGAGWTPFSMTTAAGSAVISGGSVSGVTITNPGSGYSSVPSVTFSGGGGSGAAGTAVVSGGTVTGVTITNPGSGYTSPPAVTFSDNPIKSTDIRSVSFADATHGYAVGLFSNNTKGRLLETTDGGATWTYSSDSSALGPVDAVAVIGGAGGASHSLVAVGVNGIIYKLGGVSWSDSADTVATNLAAASVTSGTANTLAGMTAGAGNLYAAGSGGAVTKSTDGGNTWNLVAGAAGAASLYGSSFINTTTGWMVGSSGTVVKTTDGGQTWTPDNNTGSGAISPDVTLRSVHFLDANTGFAVGSCDAASCAGGFTPPISVAYKYSSGVWSQMSGTAGSGLFSVHMTSATSGWAVGKGSIVLRTSNGSSWAMDSTLNDPADLNGASATDASANGWIAGQTACSTGNAAGTATISGGTVTGVTITIPGSGYASPPAVTFSGGGGSGAAGTATISGGTVTGVTITNNGSGYTSPPTVTFSSCPSGQLTKGAIYKYSGGVWSATYEPSTDFMASVTMIDASTGYAVGDWGVVFKTTDGGATWTPQNSGTSKLLASVSFSSASNGFAVGDQGRVIHTLDGGATWSAENLGTFLSMYTTTALGDRTAFVAGDKGSVLKANRPYYWTWYDNQSTNTKNWVLMANPVGSPQTDSFDLFIGGTQWALPGGSTIAPGSTKYAQYLGIIGGPVNAASLTSDKAITSQRVLWKGDSLEELPGQDIDNLSDHYYWTWYDQTGGKKNWVMVSNPNPFDVYCEIRIDGALKGSYTVPAGQDIIPTFDGVMNGPVEAQAWTTNGKTAPANIIASQRVLSNSDTAFNEVPGTAARDLSSDYLWTWYDQQSANALDWVMIANPGNTTIYYQIDIAGAGCVSPGGSGGCDSGALAPLGTPGDKVTKQFPNVMGGPVEVRTWADANHTTPVNSIASQRSIFGPSFEEVPGMPKTALNAVNYWTWYDQQSAGALNWVMVANPASAAGNVYYDIYVGSDTTPKQSDQGTGANGGIPPGGNIQAQFNGLQGGPVVVKLWSDKAHTTPATGVVSQRVLWNGFFNEVLGTPLN